MGTVPVTIKVRREILELAEEMVRLGIARSRNHAFNIILEVGFREAKRMVERRRAVKELVKKFMEEGLPFENLPTARDVEEERLR